MIPVNKLSTRTIFQKKYKNVMIYYSMSVVLLISINIYIQIGQNFNDGHFLYLCSEITIKFEILYLIRSSFFIIFNGLLAKIHFVLRNISLGY